ncbi:MAG: winged helix-turn-helix domain-containing protein [Gammaproteobacteria bacterium]|nr:winged helix-turn-helix domain-containing protein [Gammaproteobacteria bacterium]
MLGELAIDYDRHRVTICGDPVILTATEFELLRALSLNAGRVVAYDTLLARVWSGRGKADANLVRIFVRNLRRKLGDDAANPTWIFNERGVGYRMPEPGKE